VECRAVYGSGKVDCGRAPKISKFAAEKVSGLLRFVHAHKTKSMAKPKLKGALDAHKGVDYKQVKEKKKQKEAEKRKRVKEERHEKTKAAIEEDELENGASEEISEDDEEGGVLIDQEAVGIEIAADEEKVLQAELKALLGNKKKLMEIDSGSDVVEDEDDKDEWESAAEDLDGEDEDGDGEEEDSSEEEEQGVCTLSRLL
jgi:rRNA-processing protein EBP2